MRILHKADGHTLLTSSAALKINVSAMENDLVNKRNKKSYKNNILEKINLLKSHYSINY